MCRSAVKPRRLRKFGGLRVERTGLGPEDPLTLNLRGGLAEAYRALDRPDEAARRFMSRISASNSGRSGQTTSRH